MGHADKARKVTWLTFLVAAAFVTIVLVTPGVGRLVGLGTHIAWYFVFPSIHHREFEEWTTNHKDVVPSNGWKAVGWGFAGLVIYMGFALVIGILLDLLGLLDLS